MTGKEHRTFLIEMLSDEREGARDYYLSDDDRKVIVEALKMQETSEWIPCSERLPDRNGTYLVTVSSYDETATINYVAVDHGNCDGTFLDNRNKRHPNAKRGKYISAWMPCPEPYKEDENER